MAKFEYQAPDDDDIKRRASRSLSGYDSIILDKFSKFTPKEGFNPVRILPHDRKRWPDLSHWAMEVYVHRDIGPDHGHFLCLDKMRGEPCPICEARRDLDSRGRADKETLDALKAQSKFICWIIDRNDERTGPKIYEFSASFERDICNLCIDKRRGKVLSVDHPDDGYDLEIDRRGTGLTTKYDKKLDREPTYLHDKQAIQDEWLAFVSDNPLPSVLVYQSYEYIKKAFAGQAEGRDRDLDDDDDRGSRRRSRLRDEEDGEDRSSRSGGREGRERTRDTERDSGRDEGRSRRRSRDDDDEAPRGRSTRDEAEAEEREERPSRERTRTRDEAPDDDDRRSRRGEPEEDRGRSRSRGDDDAPRERSRREEPEEDRGRTRREEPEPEEEQPRQRRRAAEPDPEPEQDEAAANSDEVAEARERLRKMAEKANKKD